MLLLLSAEFAATAQNQPHRVLVLHSFRHSLPINTDWHNGLVRGFTSAPDLRVEIDIEAPDVARFGDKDYVASLLDIYRRKYGEEKPHLIVPTYTPALRFLLEHGESLFPGVPIVFCGADRQFVATQDLAAHATGIVTHRDIAGTLVLALRIHPEAQRVALISGSGAVDQQLEDDARRALQAFETRVESTWLRGMPLGELTEAVSTLPAETVILYLAQTQDRTGKSYVPVNDLPQLSAAANAPIYGLWDTLLGHGIIGGRLITLEDDGFQGAQMGLRILRGEAPADIAVVERQQNSAIFDAQELARWNIDESQLPAGSRIVNRRPSVWGQYGIEIALVGLVLALQGLLILGLLHNRAKLQRTQAVLQRASDARRQTQMELLGLRASLARFSKERSLGSLATAIAHEINQPLIAIQNYAQAARRRLQSNVDPATKVNDLIEKTEEQAIRAGAIIARVRNLLNREDADLQAVPLDSLIERTLRTLGPEIENQGCRLDLRVAADLPPILADELQIQLLLINLLQNAFRSMASMEDQADKVVAIEARQINDREVEVSVKDLGTGVSPESVEHLFEPLYSDAKDGMGMGLAICRTIVEAHNGHIWYTPRRAGGAIFHFTLQAAASKARADGDG